MKKIIFLAIAAIVITMLLFVSCSSDKPNYDSFASCLAGKNAVMYGTYWCKYCNVQKKDFGDSFRLIDYVECSEEPDLCTEKDIQGFPTWIIGSVKYPGKQSLSRLSALTRCELPKEVK